MEQQTDGGSEPGIVQKVDSAASEYDLRRTREENRHERKMERIEEAEQEALDDLYYEAGLGEVEERHEELRDLADEVASLVTDVRSRVYEVITEYLSGGYNETITVKRGAVHRYNKQRNSLISFKTLINENRSYRRNVLNALQMEAPSGVASSMEHAFDEINHRVGGRQSSWSEDTAINPVTREVERSYKTEVHEYDMLKIRYYTSPRQGNYSKVKFWEDSDSISTNDYTTIATERDYDSIKLLAQVREPLLELMDNVENGMEVARDNWQETYDRVDSDLPLV